MIKQHADSEHGQPLGLPLNDQLGLVPKFWRGPNGACMPTEYFAPWQTAYPHDAAGWEPLFTADQIDAAVAAERERCAHLVETQDPN